MYNLYMKRNVCSKCGQEGVKRYDFHIEQIEHKRHLPRREQELYSKEMIHAPPRKPNLMIQFAFLLLSAAYIPYKINSMTNNSPIIYSNDPSLDGPLKLFAMFGDDVNSIVFIKDNILFLGAIASVPFWIYIIIISIIYIRSGKYEKKLETYNQEYICKNCGTIF